MRSKGKNTTYDLLLDAGAFAVNILAADQEEHSNRFADRLCDRNGEWQVWPEDRDKFADLQFRRGLQSGGATLIDGCVAHLECRLNLCFAVGITASLSVESKPFIVTAERTPYFT